MPSTVITAFCSLSLTDTSAAPSAITITPLIVGSISVSTNDYAQPLEARLNSVGVRTESDLRSEKLGYKIREAQLQKIPYMLVIGDRDMENGTVSVRTRGGVDLGAMSPADFEAKCLKEIATKDRSF